MIEDISGFCEHHHLTTYSHKGAWGKGLGVHATSFGPRPAGPCSPGPDIRAMVRPGLRLRAGGRRKDSAVI